MSASPTLEGGAGATVLRSALRAWPGNLFDRIGRVRWEMP